MIPSKGVSLLDVCVNADFRINTHLADYLLAAFSLGRAYNIQRGVAVQRMFLLRCSRLFPAARPQGRLLINAATYHTFQNRQNGATHPWRRYGRS
jgi:hypothetical protein